MHSFVCYYCAESTEKYNAIINHLCERHKSDNLKYKELKLDYSTGQLAYRTKLFENVKPVSHDIQVSEDGKIRVHPKSRETSQEHAQKNKELELPKNATDLEDSANEINVIKGSVSEIDLAPANLVHENINEGSDFEEIYEAIPGVIDTLREHGQLNLYKKWCTLVANKSFPMDNICYLLFLDVVEWFSNTSSSQMRYMQDVTLKFWKVGYKLFHGKFLRFMSGPRSSGKVLSREHEQGFCLTNESQINFAVPSKSVLSKDPIQPVFPGTLTDRMLKEFSNHLRTKQVKIGIDGKKIARGKGKEMGDIDCWGFETPPTLNDCKARFNAEFELTSTLYKNVDDIEQDNIPSSLYASLKIQLRGIVKMLGGRLKDLRECNMKLERGIEKFIQLSENEKKNWKKTRYAPVISSMKVNRYDVEQAIDSALRLTNKLLLYMSAFNFKRNAFSDSGFVDLSTQENYNELRADNDTDNPKFFKQRTSKWHTIRNKAMVTGSTCNAACGLSKLKDMKTHFEKVVNGKVRESTPTEQQKKNMEYGTLNEIHGIATVVSRLLPAYYPDVQFFEEGCMPMYYNDKECFLVVSPDGSFRESSEKEPTIMFENKCKTHNTFSTDVFYKIPLYYIPQLLCEMHAYSCRSLLFSCWSPKSTTVFKVSFDSETWKKIWDISCSVYGCKKPICPTRFPETIHDLREMIRTFQSNNVEFLAEIESCKAISVAKENHINDSDKDSPYLPKARQMEQDDHDSEQVAKDEMLSCFHEIQNWQKSTYNLCRTTASEIIVYMVNDLDRCYHAEITNAHPIAYALKGYSMTNECFREMLWSVIEKCERNGLDVLGTASDGQWHKFGVRNWDEKPLTVYQLQRDVWNTEKTKPKPSILTELRNRYLAKDLNDIKLEKKGNKLVVYGHTRDMKMSIFKSPATRYSVTDRVLDTNSEQTKKGESCPETVSSPPGTNTDSLHEMDTINDQIIPNVDIIFDSSRRMPLNNLICSDIERENIIETNMDENVFSTHSQTVCYLDELKQLPDVSECESFGIESAYNALYWGVENEHLQDNTMHVNSLLSNFQYERPDNETDQYVMNPVMYTDSDLSKGPNSSEKCSRATSSSTQLLSTSHNAEISYYPESGEVTVASNYITPNEDSFVKNALQCLQNARSTRKKWNDLGINTFRAILHHNDKICKELTKSEILMCFEASTVSSNNTFCVRKSWKKDRLANALRLLSDGGNFEVPANERSSKHKMRSPSSLKKLAYSKIKTFPKETLTSLVCEDKWEMEVKSWREKSTCKTMIETKSRNKPVYMTWFSQPHADKFGKVRFHFTDCSHILTCLRTKICTTGISRLRQKAWYAAAVSESTSLNLAIVTECIDKQSVAFAKRVFGEDVEDFMLDNNYHNEARFVHLIREWYEAEDDAGISADDRFERRLHLREYLLKFADFSRFPYKTQYIGGIPVLTYEALLVHIERKLQIYQFLNSENGYNARALGTQEVEQFFSTIRDLDPSGLGTPKPDDIPDMIGKAVFLDNIRLNPDRGFHMTTASSTVYPEPEFQRNDSLSPDGRPMLSDTIVIRDNFFDNSDRIRVKGKRKSGLISGPECPPKRQRGVRQYHVSDESKILAHVRKGLADI